MRNSKIFQNLNEGAIQEEEHMPDIDVCYLQARGLWCVELLLRRTDAAGD